MPCHPRGSSKNESETCGTKERLCHCMKVAYKITVKMYNPEEPLDLLE
jgi:hypothetical protein